MKKLGVIVDSLGPNELAYHLISSGNALIQNMPKERIDLIVFFQNILPQCLPLQFSSMNLSEAYDYNGTLIATDLLAASKMVNYPGPKRKIFYVWDLEWIRLPNRNYDSFAECYGDERLELFCRSKQHQFFIKNAWGREAKIIEYCNLEEFAKLI